MADDRGKAGGAMPLIAAAIRREREALGLSLSELARRAGLGKSTLSQLEAGQGNPGIETLWALAAVLDVPVSRLLSSGRPGVRLIRAGCSPTVQAADADYAATLLASSRGRTDLYRLVVQPGAPHRSAPHGPGTIEHLILASGSALAGPADAPVRLGAGDYLTYPADLPHVFEALGPGTCAVLLIEHP